MTCYHGNVRSLMVPIHDVFHKGKWIIRIVTQTKLQGFPVELLVIKYPFLCMIFYILHLLSEIFQDCSKNKRKKSQRYTRLLLILFRSKHSSYISLSPCYLNRCVYAGIYTGKYRQIPWCGMTLIHWNQDKMTEILQPTQFAWLKISIS